MDSIVKMSSTEKVAIVFREAAKRLPRTVGDALLEMISPANLAMTAGVFVVFAVGQAFGYGLIVDIIAIGGGVLLAGAAAIDGVKCLVDAVAKTTSATNMADLERAGELLAQAVMSLGVSTLVSIFAKKAVVSARMASTTSAAVSSRYSTYRALANDINNSGMSGKFEAHHLWEKRFAHLIQVAEDDIISAPVLPRYHRAVNDIVKTPGVPLGIPYGVVDANIDRQIVSYLTQRLKVSPSNATLEQVWVAHREVYMRIKQANWADAIYELYVKPRNIPYWGGAK